MIGRSDVEAAWRLIQPHVRRTPALELPAGTLGVSSPLALKLESLQVSGSFKGRGAFHKLLASDVPAAGIVAASGGNHGAAAAYAARALGHKAEIFVPTIASPAQGARLKGYGAVVHPVGGVYSAARALSAPRAPETGARLPPGERRCRAHSPACLVGRAQGDRRASRRDRSRRPDGRRLQARTLRTRGDVGLRRQHRTGLGGLKES